VGYRVVAAEHLTWTTRPHAPDQPARHTAELSELAGFLHTRANLWRYEPGAHGRRHVHANQEETFVVLDGTLTMYLGEPPVRQDVTAGGLIHVTPGTPVQTANHGDTELIVYAYGSPPDQGADVLPDAV
jgi:quercetin dioxygenase-like cupin family protein